MLLRHKSARNLVRVLKIHKHNQAGSMARWVTGLQGLGGVKAIHRKRGYSAFAMHFTMRETKSTRGKFCHDLLYVEHSRGFYYPKIQTYIA